VMSAHKRSDPISRWAAALRDPALWSRRITEEHRVVYKAEEDGLIIAQLRYHY